MPPAILLVKTSSLGDVVHNLPVVSDIRTAFPQARIDWVVERAFASIPSLHPGVDRVLRCSIRAWRKRPFGAGTRADIRRLRHELDECAYDAVIDTQGLLKSALVSRLASSGVRHGLDWRSSREPLSLFYDRVHKVPWGRHAVVRNRELAAMALGYAVPAGLHYGIRPPDFPPAEADDDSPADPDRPWLSEAQRHSWLPSKPFAVLLHASSAEAKFWPEYQWKKLIAHLSGEGLASVLPWGSAGEHARAVALAEGLRDAVVAPRLGLRTLAGVIGKSAFCIGVDTGLTHFAAALGTKTVGIYVATDPAATGVLAPGNGVNVGGKGAPPTLVDVLYALKNLQ